MAIFAIPRPAPPQSVSPQSDLLHLCRKYRDAFTEAEVAYPAGALKIPGAANWVRGHGLMVDVCFDDELGLAASAGIRPARIVVHGDAVSELMIRNAVAFGVRQFIIGSPRPIAALAGNAQVVVDVTSECAEDAVMVAAAHQSVTLIGLHGRLGVQAVDSIVDRMAQIRRHYGAILSRLSLGGDVDVIDVPMVAASIEDALDDVCARWRFPRPALVITPR